MGATDDSLLQLAAKLQPALLRIENERKTREGELLRLRPACMQALIAYREQQGRAVYPDANSTLRVSYGKVTSLKPRDAVRYEPLSTLTASSRKTPARHRSMRRNRCWTPSPKGILPVTWIRSPAPCR